MREQEASFRRGYEPRSAAANIRFADHIIVDAGEPERASARLKPQAFVDQHVYAFAAEKMCDQIGVGPMIMVAETRDVPNSAFSSPKTSATGAIYRGSCET